MHVQQNKKSTKYLQSPSLALVTSIFISESNTSIYSASTRFIFSSRSSRTEKVYFFCRL